jgi:hypothetical protein
MAGILIAGSHARRPGIRAGRRDFFEDLSQHKVDGWLLLGDIGEAESESLVSYLRELENLLPVRICSVLGNHDFSRGSIAQVKADVRLLSSRSEQLRKQIFSFFAVTRTVPVDMGQTQTSQLIRHKLNRDNRPPKQLAS